MTSSPDTLFSPATLPVLAFGSSGSWCSVALLWAERRGLLPAPGADTSVTVATQSACASEQAGQAHSQRLLPMTYALLAQAGLALPDIALIGLDAGPGGFTSLRIGCGLAQGLALGLGCPIVPVASLRALAWPHRAVRCLTATDARMGEVYMAAWPGQQSPDFFADSPIIVGSPTQLAALITQVAAAHVADADGRGASERAAWIATGDAFAAYPEMADLARAHGARVLVDTFPSAEAVARIAANAWARGEAVSPEQAAPIYIRNKVALDVDEQRALREAREAAR